MRIERLQQIWPAARLASAYQLRWVGRPLLCILQHKGSRGSQSLPERADRVSQKCRSGADVGGSRHRRCLIVNEQAAAEISSGTASTPLRNKNLRSSC